uniref:Uncharacterized protein n=1 Tax=Hemiselmis andersenii TaxID=464988 RepID=A0A7S0Y734_HEMAN|mmetsp:Transcript_41708/g.96753  ORF Transcript_41708/g.96753 Transcript_41708/m.96753 type:complete len:127 (+) Transcript_41708:26-406(+)
MASPSPRSAQHDSTVDDEEVARALQAEYNRETNDLRRGEGWQPPEQSDYHASGYQPPSQGPTQPPPGAYCPVECRTCHTVNHVPYTTGIAAFRCTNCAFHNQVDLTIRGGRRYHDPYMPFLFCTIS